MSALRNCDDINKYNDNLTCCLDNFLALRNDIKTGYVNWKMNDDKAAYDNAINKKNVNVDSLISKLRVKLNRNYNSNKERLNTLNNNLVLVKESLDKWSAKYKKEKNQDLAAGPLEKDTSKLVIQEYLYLGFLTVGTIFTSAFLFKTFKL